LFCNIPFIFTLIRYYLSLAPHALPQEAGFSSGAAAPHAAGASAGLSPAPQELPQDDAAVFHSAMFESAILNYLLIFYQRFVPCDYNIAHFFSLRKYALFCYFYFYIDFATDA
jgi:hypothetical protein